MHWAYFFGCLFIAAIVFIIYCIIQQDRSAHWLKRRWLIADGLLKSHGGKLHSWCNGRDCSASEVNWAFNKEQYANSWSATPWQAKRLIKAIHSGRLTYQQAVDKINRPYLRAEAKESARCLSDR